MALDKGQRCEMHVIFKHAIVYLALEMSFVV